MVAFRLGESLEHPLRKLSLKFDMAVQDRDWDTAKGLYKQIKDWTPV